MIELKNIGSILKTKKCDLSGPENGAGGKIGIEGMTTPEGGQKIGNPAIMLLENRIGLLNDQLGGRGMTPEQIASLDREKLKAEISTLQGKIDEIKAHLDNKYSVTQ